MFCNVYLICESICQIASKKLHSIDNKNSVKPNYINTKNMLEIKT